MMLPSSISRRQNGVVLVIALVLLVLLSLIASYNARNVGSAELVSNNTRSAELAAQAAEAALRQCERDVENHFNILKGSTASFASLMTPTAAPVGVSYTWQTLTNWDGTTSVGVVRVINTATLALSDASGNLYKRPPECMAQYRLVANTRSVVITARGFGPEVAADSGGTRPIPQGSEVWLQSTISLN
jgi:type IV pilus assembly protein PilX